MKLSRLLPLLCVGALVLSSCAGRKDSPPENKPALPESKAAATDDPEDEKKPARPVVGFVSNVAVDFWLYAEAGAKKAAAEAGVELVFRMPEKGDAGEQMQIIEALKEQGARGIAVVAIDPANQTDGLKKIAGKVSLVTVDTDAPESGRLAFVGADHYTMGGAAGKRVRELFPDGCTIAIFVGMTTPLSARQRIGGILDELAGKKDAEKSDLGKYKLYRGEAMTDNADRRQAVENANRVLADLRDEKNVCLVGIWSYNPPAILEAVKAKDRVGKVKVVGFDEDPATLEGVRKGDIDSTVVQQPFEYGYRAVKLLAGHVKDGTKPKADVVHVPHEVITSKNVDAFAKGLKALLAPGKPKP